MGTTTDGHADSHVVLYVRIEARSATVVLSTPAYGSLPSTIAFRIRDASLYRCVLMDLWTRRAGLVDRMRRGFETRVPPVTSWL